MLRVRIVVVGRTRLEFLRQGEALYLKRLEHYARTEWIEVRGTRLTRRLPPAQALQREADEILKALGPRSFTLALDPAGRLTSSEGWAHCLARLSQTHSHLTFIIGGPLGLDPSVTDRADGRLSLSPLTLTHEMSRLVLLEQLYRAFTILNNENYHK